jgi:N-acetylglucosaminyl-diphospho-decaprenol L-rhamnosyltransferase
MNDRAAPQVVPTVGVVTVSYGSEDVLPGFLASLPAASATPLSVVVVDNKPEAHSPIAASASASGAQYLPQSHNLGYGGAMNAGVASLDPLIEWVLLSNPDVVVAPGTVDTLVATAATDPRVGAVGPAILNDDGGVYPSARSVPSLRTGVGHALFANIWISNPWTRAYRRDTEAAPVARDAGWLSGACLLVRRSAFAELGGFDDAYFMYFEDVDLGYRLGKAGYLNRYEPAAIVSHSGAHSTTGESGRMIAAHHESARRFLNRKYAGWYLWPIRATLTIGLTVRSAMLRARTSRRPAPTPPGA